MCEHQGGASSVLRMSTTLFNSCCDFFLQVDAYIRQVNGLPPREPPQPRAAAAAAAPADTAEPSEGNGRRNRGTVHAEQVGSAGCMPAIVGRLASP
jgi:hypothetical protein